MTLREVVLALAVGASAILPLTSCERPATENPHYTSRRFEMQHTPEVGRPSRLEVYSLTVEQGNIPMKVVSSFQERGFQCDEPTLSGDFPQTIYCSRPISYAPRFNITM